MSANAGGSAWIEAARAAGAVLAGHAADVDASGRFPLESVDALRAAGLLGLCLPPEAGGSGEGPRAFAGVTEQLAQGCGSTAMIYVMHVVAAQVIAASPTLAARGELLAAIANGRHVTTLAFSEPGSRSHFWAPISQLVADNGGYVVSARKSWVTAAGHTDSYVSAGRSPDATSALDSTLYLARPGEGVRVGGGFDGLGLRGNESVPVVFERVAVSRGDLLTAPGDGARALLELVLPWFSIGTSAMATGLCRAAVDATCRHLEASTLEHTGERLRDLPVLRARVAEMSVRTEQAAALLDRAVQALEKSSAASGLAVLQCRLSALQAAVDVTDLAMKACGGAAFSRRLPLERLFRDARAGWVMAPTVDQLRDFIGRTLTGLPLF